MTLLDHVKLVVWLALNQQKGLLCERELFAFLDLIVPSLHFIIRKCFAQDLFVRLFNLHICNVFNQCFDAAVLRCLQLLFELEKASIEVSDSFVLILRFGISTLGLCVVLRVDEQGVVADV